MEEKEKAKEIWLSYYELIDDIYSTEAAKDLAKNQSLIAVDEIMDFLYEKDLGYMYYWEEVKREIHKL